ncbi:MAG: rod shape-determining protein RodA [Desulfobacterales bacterium]|nr:rod shape-determining protein RodA [Desulfobacterales bacterium]
MAIPARIKSFFMDGPAAVPFVDKIFSFLYFLMFDRRLIQYFDWGLLLIALLIAGIGLLLLYSAVQTSEIRSILYYKQMVWLSLGFLVMVAVFLFNYKHLDQWSLIIYIGCVGLLLLVFVFGKHVGGSTRWLAIGPFTLQPSEPVKLGVIIILAKYLASAVKPAGLDLKDLIPPMVLTGIPFLLVAAQPDLGTAGTIALIAATMVIFAKIERKTLVFFILVIAVTLPLGWNLLEPYQQERILTLIFPNRDPLGAGYHIRQSKIAVGSGMLFGKGYLDGTQKMLAFLPEQHTDFIFSVLAEEWGFVGSFAVLFLYLFLIAFGLNVAYACRDKFGAILAVGITAMFFWQVFTNIGMVIGIMPVVGMPLPLMSYGGSSILTSFIGLGLLMNISMRKFMKD